MHSEPVHSKCFIFLSLQNESLSIEYENPAFISSSASCTNEWLNDKGKKIHQHTKRRCMNVVIPCKNCRQSRKLACKRFATHPHTYVEHCWATTNNKIFPLTNYACFYSVVSAFWWWFPHTRNSCFAFSLLSIPFIVDIFFPSNLKNKSISNSVCVLVF